jgi:hypothetical protein
MVCGASEAVVRKDRPPQSAELTAAIAETNRVVAGLAQQVGKLTTAVNRLSGQVANIHGTLTETSLADKAEADLSRLAYDLHRVGRRGMGVLLDQAVASGRVTLDEAADVRRADAYYRGKLRSDDTEAVFVVEVSSNVDRTDVERAHRRADHLRTAGVQGIAVVVGNEITSGGAEAADALGVLRIVAGTMTSSSDAA